MTYLDINSAREAWPEGREVRRTRTRARTSRTVLAPSFAPAKAPIRTVTHKRPLVVDLDGTLVRSDLLIERAFAEIGQRPQSLLDILVALRHGKAALKHRLSDPVDFDPALLPYDDEVLACIRQAQEDGRPIYLASASNERLVSAVADHLGLFNGWFASDATNNLSGTVKADHLAAVFGERGFDYIGNDWADLPVWSRAFKAVTIRAPAGVVRRLPDLAPEVESLPCSRPTWRAWAKLLRVHQYAKNALVFVPLLTAHLFNLGAAHQAVLAAIAFCLCASGVYVLNDLIDLQADRRHHSKRRRPLASGAIPVLHGVIAVPVLIAASMFVAATVSLPFLAVLTGYFALTTAYSFVLKRKMLIDVVTLASLYTIRVIGGAVAIEVAISEWLLAFCMGVFMSLALIKRVIELAALKEASKEAPANRGYRTSDLEIVTMLAGAAGFNAVTVFALYISSDAVNQLYSHPDLLWLVCPVLMYWIGRALMLAHRREMDDDPVVFALKDRGSLLTITAAVLLVVAAI